MITRIIANCHHRGPYRAPQSLDCDCRCADGGVFAGSGGGWVGRNRRLGADRLSVTVSSLTSLSVYLVPLVALLMSFDAVAGEVERGTLPLLLSISGGTVGIAAGQAASASRDLDRGDCGRLWRRGGGGDCHRYPCSRGSSCAVATHVDQRVAGGHVPVCRLCAVIAGAQAFGGGGSGDRGIAGAGCAL